MSRAPDGTPLEVRRNHGKPNAAKALRQAAKGDLPTEPIVAPPIPAPSLESLADRAKEVTMTETKTPPKRGIQLSFTGMKAMHVVEAALFAAGKPILVEEIAEAAGMRPEAVKQGIKDLQKAYDERDTVLEIAKAGAKWAMQVRSRASEPAAKFAPMEIPVKVLKTLALIAYHQPIKQSELVDMLGTKVYDHVPELKERGLVKTREEGVTKILTTTALFPEYFGLDAQSPDEVRMKLAKLVGMDPNAAPKPAPTPTPPPAVDAPPADEAAPSEPEGAEPTDGHEAHLQH